MKLFSPDVWLVYGACVKNPDLFGWWLHRKRYLLLNTYVGSGKELPWWWRWLFVMAYRRSLARADTVAAERPKNADELRSYGLTEDRLRIFPPAVNTHGLIASREEARRRLGFPQDAPIILCVSRLTAPRNDAKPWKTEWILELLETAARASLPPNVLIVLVGDGPGRGRVETRIASLKLEERVRLAGAVPNEEVAWFYAACDLFAYPDMRDRMFNTILEAQACGRPVLTTLTRSTRLTVDGGRTGVLARDLSEFQTYLGELARDRARCESMGAAGPTYIAQFHSIENRVSQVEEFLLGRAAMRESAR
jgi:glycosyltransferase involved in cell wall biosynthesis